MEFILGTIVGGIISLFIGMKIGINKANETEQKVLSIKRRNNELRNEINKVKTFN